MDPIANPFASGAGVPPPELAGRDAIIEKASIALQRLARGDFGRSMILTGLRGVGKTALLNKIRRDADAAGFVTIRLEAAEGRSLPSLVAPGLRTALLKVDHMKAASDGAKRALRALASFAGAMKLTYQDIELKLDVASQPGIADAPRLDESLAQLLAAVGEAAREKETVVVLFIDELHVVPPAELAALIMALHLAAQDLLPITLMAAGSPPSPARMGEAQTYAERLFEFPRIDRLTREAARLAILKPAADRGVVFTEDAFDEIYLQTKGYAYFLQEWGKHAWDAADASPIDIADVRDCRAIAIAALDESFFSLRFGQLTRPQKQYLRAMAELGPGPHRSGDVAAAMGKKVTSVAVTRDQLIAKGMVYGPIHGETAFTVPMFDEFLKRVLPEPPGGG